VAAGQVTQTGRGRRWRRRDTPDHGRLRRHQPHLPAGSPAPQVMAAVRNLAIGVLAEQDRSMPPRSGSTAATPRRPLATLPIRLGSNGHTARTPEPWPASRRPRLALQQPPRLLLIPGVVGQRLRDRFPHLVSERLILRLRGVLLITPPPGSRANREGAWAIDCSADGTRSASTLVGTGQLATTAGDPHLRMGPACGSSCDDTARMPGRPVRGRAFE
jgi:hypothetical protein